MSHQHIQGCTVPIYSQTC